MDQPDFRLENLVIQLHYEDKINLNHKNTQIKLTLSLPINILMTQEVMSIT